MAAPDAKRDKLRTMVLAGAAVTLIGLLAADTLLNKEASTPVSTASKSSAKAKKEAPLMGAPPNAGVKELLKRYDAVLDTGPFTTRSFLPKPKRPKPRPRRRDPDPPKPTKPAGPQPIKVRWTGVIGEGADASAVLEERSTGRGLFASPGQKVGEIAFLSVAPETLEIETAGTKRKLALGDSIDLPHTAKDQLEKLGPPQPEGSSAESGGGKNSTYKAKVKLTSDRRKAILERLRARRKASLEKKKAAAAKTKTPKKEGK